MKTDFTTAVLAAIIGIVISSLVVYNIFPDPENVVVKSVESIGSDVDDPDPEVFNYRAVNPTVETYIDCTNYDLSGNCLEKEQQPNPEG